MHVIGKDAGVEESERFLESLVRGKGGVERQQRSPRVLPRGRHATHAKHISTQVFREFAVPTLHSNDLRPERETRNTIATRNETLRTEFPLAGSPPKNSIREIRAEILLNFS